MEQTSKMNQVDRYLSDETDDMLSLESMVLVLVLVHL